MSNNPLDRDENSSESLNDTPAEQPTNRLPTRLQQFERLYRAEFGHVAAYFARRTLDPQLVANLTADTFVAAIQSFDSFDAERVRPQAWALGLARRVYLRHRESDPRGAEGAHGITHQLLDAEERAELLMRIEVESASRSLIERLERMSILDREAVELVDLCELSPAEAARELGISSGALRVRLLRTRARLRRESQEDV